MDTSTGLYVAGGIAVPVGVSAAVMSAQASTDRLTKLDVNVHSFRDFQAALAANPDDDFLLAMGRTELDLLADTKVAQRSATRFGLAGIIGGVTVALGGLGALVGAELLDDD